MVSKEFFIDI